MSRWLNSLKNIKKFEKKKAVSLSVFGFLILATFLTVSNLDKRQNLSQRAAPGDKLTVNVTQNIAPFSKEMLGMAFVNWEHSWGKPYPGEIPGLAQAMKEQGVGVIRYAGGLWANAVGFDRTNQRIPYEPWVKNGETYYFSYGVDEMASLNTLADAVGAEVMIQVNISDNDPSMWADMVRYINIERGYNFKYWELGNEFDHDTDKNVTPDIYAARLKTYIDAMKSVDPSIKIIAGVPAGAHDAPRQGYSDAVTEMSQYLSKSATALSPQGRKADDLSFHWYQQCNNTNLNEFLIWSFSGLNQNSWRNSYSRIWSEIAPKRIQNEIIGNNTSMRQGITEYNYDSCNYDSVLNGNHLNALWLSDTLGRFAYNGIDFITWYEGYGTQGYSTIYPNNGDNPTSISVRPSYYAFYMYNKYFGDQIVGSNTFDPTQISIWASKDSDDPNKLKLRITNLTSNDISVPVEITGTTATNGSVYTLSSTSPASITATSNQASAPTSINGVKFNGMSIAQSAASIVPSNIAVNGSTFTYTFPAYSSVAIVLNTGNIPTTQPTATPTTITPTPTRTPTPTPTRTPTPSPSILVGKTGDINGDNQVGILDLSILLSNWGSTNPSNPKADINSDGTVGILDLSILLSNWGL